MLVPRYVSLQRSKHNLVRPVVVVVVEAGPCCSGFLGLVLCLAVALSSRAAASLLLPAELPSSTPSTSPLFPFCINLNWLQSYLNSLLSTAAMFSRAIRQSSRRVAAISASGRIASVSPSQPPQFAPAAVAAIACSSQTASPMPLAPQWSFVDGVGAAVCGGGCEELPSTETEY